jgi:putative membrane protein
MLKHTLLPLVAALALILTAPARAGEPPKEAGGGDVKFVNMAARDGEAEVILGKLAADKASSEDVKKFGQQMVDDHTKANEELKSIAKSKNIDLEKAQANGTKKGERISQKLSKLEGAEFDKGYVGIMLKEHESAVKQFEGQSKDGQDEDLKAFAAKTLPTLQHHLEMVKELQSKVGKLEGGAGGGGGGGGGGGQKKEGDAEVKTRE